MSVTLDRPAALAGRTKALLEAPILPMLLRMAWPNVLVMLAQTATGLIETFWISRLGTDALAGMALVFPGVMLMQMLSAGAMGGGISAAVARALGGRRQADADGFALHAIVINAGIGAVFTVVMLVWGAAVYGWLGGRDGSLHAALAYSNVVFGFTILLWVMNALASIIRGAGNMLVPAVVTCIGVVLLVPLSPVLIYGWGPVPALGVAGGGWALAVFYLGSTAYMGWYLVSGRAGVALTIAPLRWALFRPILSVGAASSVNGVLTNLVIALTTAFVGQSAGPDAVAGYGTAARLEYLLIPLVFGLGAPLVALVGTNIGAGQTARALRIAWTGAALAFGMTELVGLAAAVWPQAWLELFGHDPAMVTTGTAYLRVVGPAYGLFGGGLALYFASQGAGRLTGPLAAGLLRAVIAIAGGWLLLRWTGSLAWLFVAVSAGLVIYGGMMAAIINPRAWRERKPA